MNRFFQIALLITALFLYHCAQKPGAPPLPVPRDAGQKLFDSAGGYFQGKDYDKALEVYQAYLRQYPDHPLVPAAKLKIGDTYAALGKIREARKAYNDVIAQYPDSVFAENAKLGLVDILFRNRAYSEVLLKAADIREDRLSGQEAIRFFMLMGETYKAMGAAKDAVYNYARAFDKAEESEKKSIYSKLQELLPELDSDDLAVVIDRLGDTESGGYLVYRLSLLKAKKQQYDEAIKLLEKFTETFPEHEYADQAGILIDEFKDLWFYWAKKQPQYQQYTIGCMLPLSGPYAEFGHRALKGIELALHEFSADDSKPPITVIIQDTASDPNQALLAVEALDKENVAAIIGPITTAVAAAFEAQDRGIPIIALTQKDNITVIGDYVFRNFITPKMQVKTIVSYAVNGLGMDRFAILYPDEHYGRRFMNLFWDEILPHGGRLVGVESYNPNEADFGDPIKKLVGLYYEVPEDLKEVSEPLFNDELDMPEGMVLFDTPAAELDDEVTEEEEKEPEPIIDFDAVFIPDSPEKAGLLIPQLTYYDVVDVYLMGTNLWQSDQLINMAGQYMQGAIMADGFFASSRSDTVKRFTEIFKKIYDHQPGFIEAITYDTARMIFDIANRPEIASRSVLKDALLDIQGYDGVTGLTSFTEDGDSRKRLYLLRVKGDGFIEVDH